MGDPEERSWLAPSPTRNIRGKKLSETSVELEWDIAKLFDSGGRGRGSDSNPEAEYEVIYAQSDKYTANFSSPCGLYDEFRRRNAKKVSTKSERHVTIEDLQPDTEYIF